MPSELLTERQGAVLILTISDPDAGEATFQPQTHIAGSYGHFSIDATGAWYRPYLLWLILIVVTFILQSQKDADEL